MKIKDATEKDAENFIWHHNPDKNRKEAYTLFHRIIMTDGKLLLEMDVFSKGEMLRQVYIPLKVRDE